MEMVATLSLDQVAARLGVSRKTLLRRIAETGLAFTRPGRTFVFTEAPASTLARTASMILVARASSALDVRAFSRTWI